MSLSLAVASYGTFFSRAFAQEISDCSSSVASSESIYALDCNPASDFSIASGGELNVILGLNINNVNFQNLGTTTSNSGYAYGVLNSFDNQNNFTANNFTFDTLYSLTNSGTLTLNGGSNFDDIYTDSFLGNTGRAGFLPYEFVTTLENSGTLNNRAASTFRLQGNKQTIGQYGQAFNVQNTGTLNNQGTLAMTGASLAQESTLSNSGLLSLNQNSNIYNTGTLTNSGSGNLAQYSETMLKNSGTLNNHGSIAAAGAQNQFVNDRFGTFNNYGQFSSEAGPYFASSYYYNGGGTDSSIYNDGVINNQGTISFGAYVSIENISGGRIQNDGTLSANTASLSNDGRITNNGVFRTQSSQISQSNNGSLYNNAGGLVVFDNSHIEQRGGLLNDAVLTAYTGLFIRNSDFYNYSGVINNGGIELQSAHFFNIYSTQNYGLITTNNLSYEYNTGLGGYSTIYNTESGQFFNQVDGVIRQHNSSILNDGSFYNRGSISSNGNVINNSNFDNTGSVTTNLLLNTGDFDNKGSLVVKPTIGNNYNGIVLDEGAKLYNGPSGSITNESTLTMYAGTEIANEGVFKQYGASSLFNSSIDNKAGSFTNFGTITLNQGSLFNNQAEFINNGSFVLSDSSVTSTDNSHFINKGTLRAENEGTIVFKGIVENTGSISADSMEFATAEVTNNGTINASSITVSSGTFIGVGDVTVEEFFQIERNASVSAGNSPGRLSVDGDLNLYGNLLVEFEASMWDQVFVSGALTFSDTSSFIFDIANSFPLFDGASYEFLSAGNVTNFDLLDFGNFSISGLNSAFDWSVSFDDLANVFSLNIFAIDNGETPTVSSPSLLFLTGLFIPAFLCARKGRKA